MQQQDKNSRTVIFDHKKFAVDTSKKNRLYFYFISEKTGLPVSTEIYAAKYQIERDVDNGVAFARVDQMITDIWKKTDRYDILLSVNEYRETMKQQRTGIIQTELNWTQFRKECTLTHIKAEFGDMKSCLTCQVATCLQCSLPVRGKVYEIGDHFGIKPRDVTFLIAFTNSPRYVKSNYQGKQPKCILVNGGMNNE